MDHISPASVSTMRVETGYSKQETDRVAKLNAKVQNTVLPNVSEIHQLKASLEEAQSTTATLILKVNTSRRNIVEMRSIVETVVKKDKSRRHSWSTREMGYR